MITPAAVPIDDRRRRRDLDERQLGLADFLDVHEDER